MRPTESFDRTNVTEMGLELPDVERVFNPGEEITEADWLKIEQFRETAQTKDEGDFIHVVAAIAELNPAKMHVSPAEWSRMRFFITRHPNLFASAARLKRIDPEHTVIPSLKNVLDGQITFAEGSMRDNVIFLSHVEALFPEFLDKTPPDWPVIMQRLDATRRNGDGSRFANYAEAIARLAPERLVINDDDWSMMRTALDEHRSGRSFEDMYSFLSQAEAMAVIAKAVKPQTQSEELLTLPETKSF